MKRMTEGGGKGEIIGKFMKVKRKINTKIWV